MTIEARQIPRIAPGFRLQWEKAQDAWVLLYPEGMVKLNVSAGEVLQLVDGKSSISDIVETLKNKFPEADGIEADIFDFFEDAHAQQWVSFD